MGFALLLVFAYALSWIMAFIGLIVPSVEVINNASFMVVMPLTFISNAFVPIDDFLGPLIRAFADWNPVSAEVLSGVAPTDGAGTFARFGGTPEGARAIMSTVAGSTITVTGVTFSLTVVALQMASTQFTPRLLGTFLSDRGNQAVLSAFLGAFAYTLVVLRRIRIGTDAAEGYVPDLAVGIGLLLTFFSVGMLVYFFHHLGGERTLTEDVAFGIRQRAAADADRRGRDRRRRRAYLEAIANQVDATVERARDAELSANERARVDRYARQARAACRRGERVARFEPDEEADQEGEDPAA